MSLREKSEVYFHNIPKSVANYIDRGRNCTSWNPIFFHCTKVKFSLFSCSSAKNGIDWLLISSNILFVINSTQENSFALKANKTVLILECKIHAAALYTNPL